MNPNPANYSAISFPLLGIEVDPIRTLSLGPLTIHLYGAVIALGLRLAGIYCCRRSKRAGLTEDDILDGILWITPFAVACARAYYCVFSWPMYRNNPISVLYIWEGGLAIYGAVLGAAVGVIIFCRINKCALPALLGLGSRGCIIGQCIGRWGNFFNREAFGAATDAVTRMGLYNTVTGATEYYHPTFLYESLWNLVGLLLLLFVVSKHRKFDGQNTWFYFLWYGIGRFWVEGLRTDSLYLFDWQLFGQPIRVSQALSAVMVVVSLFLLVWNLVLHPHKPEELYVNQVAAREQAEQQEEKQQGE